VRGRSPLVSGIVAGVLAAAVLGVAGTTARGAEGPTTTRPVSIPAEPAPRGVGVGAAG
jgi:hypothetical protein